MTTRDLLLMWGWQPAVLLGCAGGLLAYLVAIHFRAGRGVLFFAAGVFSVLVALISPLALLGHRYLFSAHMAQHLLLVLIAPPLLWLGIPPALERRLRTPGAERTAQRGSAQPLLAWLAGAGAMWVWHLPVLFNAALRHHGLHLFEHVSVLMLGVLFWRPVVSPFPEQRLPALLAVVYLFTACIGCTILGITLTFATPGLYPAYLHPADPLGILPLLRERWGLTPATDQQLGGLLMWVPACLVYLSAVIGVLARWYATPDSVVAAAAGGAVRALPLTQE